MAARLPLAAFAVAVVGLSSACTSRPIVGLAPQCDACHGVPPAAPHTRWAVCAGCHDGYAATAVNAALHQNGRVDVNPPHPAGWAAKEQHGYGANRAGLESCRTCHGANLDGVGGTAPSCASCHDAVVDSWQTNCTFCHGTRIVSFAPEHLVSAAPPVGTEGETATSARAVGAHRRHLAGGAVGGPVTCDTCHAVPADLGHLDQVAAIEFGPDAGRGRATPAWNGTTCSSTYCHGATLTGGANTAPAWTGGAAEAACGACHGIPPPSHTSSSCGGCHPGYTPVAVNAALHLNGSLDSTAVHPPGWSAKEVHGYTANRSGLASCRICHGANLDGVGGSGPSCASCHDAVVDSWQTNCTFCHGERVRTYAPANLLSAAPPVGSEGETATTARAVGAHARHLLAAPAGPGVACDTCHAVPPDLGHLDGDARVTFGAAASLGGTTTPVWNGTTCASTYCHGATLAGGTNRAPAWTGGASQAGCGTCHAVPPPTGAHLVHASPSSPAGPVYGSVHVLEDVSPSGGSAYDFGCGHCHPLDPAQHLAHVTPDGGGAHVPDVLLGPGSAPAGSLRARNLPTARWDPATRTCSGVYCHSSGQDPAGVTSLDYAATPPWDAAPGTLGCGGCHGNPPRYASSVPTGSTARANGHLDLDDEFTGGWETGHFAGMSGPTHGSKHGGDNPKFRFNDPRQAASPITCQACHFDTVAEAPGQFFFFDPTGSYSFTAAERPFVDPSRTSVPEWAWSQCVTCHAGEARRGNVLPLRHVNGRRDVAFDRRAALPAGYPTGLPPLAGGPVRPYYVTNFTPTVGFEPNPQFRLLPDSELVAVANTTVVSLVFHTTLESARYDPATKTCSSVGCHVGRKSLEDAGYVGPLQWGQPFQWFSPTNPLCIGCHNYGAPLP